MAAKKGTKKAKTNTKTPRKQKSKVPTKVYVEPVIQHRDDDEPDLDEEDGPGDDEEDEELPHTDRMPVAPVASIPQVAASPVPVKKVLGIPKVILLRDPQFVYDDAHTKVEKIIGKCTEQVFDSNGVLTGLCENTREIAPQDAFQVMRCMVHQKMINHKKIAARRKTARAAARQAREQEERSPLDEIGGTTPNAN